MFFGDQKLKEEFLLNRQKDLMQLDKTELVELALDELEEGRKKNTVSTGFGFIDEGPCELTGGSVHFLYGHHCAGKTSFALNLVNHTLRNKGFVMYFTNRESSKDLIKMLITISAGVRSEGRHKYSKDEISKIKEAGLFIRNSDLLISEAYAGSIEYIYKQCTLKTPDLIVIDGYEGLFSLSSGRDKGRINKLLRAMARMCRCHVLVLSELTVGIGSERRTERLIMRGEDPKKIIRILSRHRKISFDEAMLIYRRDYYRLPEKHDNITTVVLTTPLGNAIIKGNLHRDSDKLLFSE